MQQLQEALGGALHSPALMAKGGGQAPNTALHQPSITPHALPQGNRVAGNGAHVVALWRCAVEAVVPPVGASALMRLTATSSTPFIRPCEEGQGRRARGRRRGRGAGREVMSCWAEARMRPGSVAWWCACRCRHARTTQGHSGSGPSTEQSDHQTFSTDRHTSSLASRLQVQVFGPHSTLPAVVHLEHHAKPALPQPPVSALRVLQASRGWAATRRRLATIFTKSVCGLHSRAG